MIFTGVLETVGKSFAKGLQWAIAYAVPVEKLAGLLFPAILPGTATVVGATSLIQTAVLLVEQKYAAYGTQASSGQQKLAEVMLLAGPVVTQLLTQAGLPTSTAYIQSLVSAIVAILNAQAMPSSATTNIAT